MTVSELTKSENPRKPSGLRYLLYSIGNGASRATMAKQRKVSKMAISKNIAALRQKGFVQTIQQFPYAIDKLTPLGERVNQMLIQSEGKVYPKENFWRCHNLIVAWKIEDFGSWAFDPARQVQMKNWNYQQLFLKGHRINVQDTGLLKMYCPEAFAKNPNEGFDQLVIQAQEVAKYMESKYQMKLGGIQRVRNGQKELMGSEKLGELIGHIRVGDIWVDISDKENRRIEADQDDNRFVKLLELPSLFDEKFIPSINWLSENIQSHRQILHDMTQTLKDIRESIKEWNKEALKK